MGPEFAIVEGGPELLDRVAPLWDRLRLHHAALDTQWENQLLARAFVDRKAELSSAESTEVGVILAQQDRNDIGYCVCTVSTEGVGEIDSLFVDESCRGRGVGRLLMDRSLARLQRWGAGEIAVNVHHANAKAIRFYEHFGFHPRSMHMRRIDRRD